MMNILSRSTETEKAYAKRGREICVRVANLCGLSPQVPLPPELAVRYLIDQKPSVSKSTWRQNKAALKFHLEELARGTGDNLRARELQGALEILSNEPQTGAMRRGTRTSAIKQKGCGRQDFVKIIRFLRANMDRYRWAESLGVLLGATYLTGLRPCEWGQAHLEELEDGVVLVVRNAKFGEHRAGQMFRRLHLSPDQPIVANAVRALLTHIQDRPGGLAFSEWLRRVSLFMTRVGRSILGRRKRYPSIYSFRHQFAADAKASGVPPEELAALMGHATDATATFHYARRAQGTAGIHVRASSADVARIRRKLRAHPSSRRARAVRI